MENRIDMEILSSSPCPNCNTPMSGEYQMEEDGSEWIACASCGVDVVVDLCELPPPNQGEPALLGSPLFIPLGQASLLDDQAHDPHAEEERP